MKILILGEGEHGKDTFADLLCEYAGLKKVASSEFVAEQLMYPLMKQKYCYFNSQGCYEDRRNHREFWCDIIKEYNRYDKSRLAEAILGNSDIYVGMRSEDEYQVSKGLFDYIFYVDAYPRLFRGGDTTMTIECNEAEMYVIDNSGNLQDLKIAAKYEAEQLTW